MEQRRSLSPNDELSLLTARVGDASLRAPLYVDGASDLVSVCRELSARGLTQALVRDRIDGRTRLGIFTTTDLRDALLREQPPQQQAVRDLAQFDLVEIGADADLFEALWLMLRHRVHRLVVREGAQVRGVLEQLDLVGRLASHPHAVALQIEQAQGLVELRDAAARIDRTVESLHAAGIPTLRLARLVGELNLRLIERLWQRVAPPELVAGSCLLVMGSEGRGEQLLKTDQDNALLLRDEFTSFASLPMIAARFSAELAALGYPPCPGGIMVTNPAWRQSLPAMRETLRGWVHGPGTSGEGAMHLAAFIDARVAAGDASLLADARSHLDQLVAGQDAFVARFARAAVQFGEPRGWLARLPWRAPAPLDLKRAGIFPIVHGTRALALEHGVGETGTAARLARLVQLRHLDEGQARDLHDALQLLLRLRLTRQLAQRARGQPLDSSVLTGELSALERESLHEALAIVGQFTGLLRRHFRLDAL